MKELRELVLFLRDIKFLLAFFGISGLSLATYKDEFVGYIIEYGVQISYLMIVLIAHYIYKSKKETRSLVKELSLEINSMKEQQRLKDIKDLKANVLSAYKQYGNTKVTDPLVASQILDYDNIRAELGVNSWTQGMCTKMIGNIDYDLAKGLMNV